MKGVARCLALGVLALTVVVPGHPAQAEDLDALVKKGVELRRQGKEKEALAMFQRAAAIKKTPRVMAQVAFAEQALGRWVSAESHLKTALEEKGDPWITKNKAVINEALKSITAHLGSLEVWGTPDGAEILVDGALIGTLPTSGAIRLPLGDVMVTVRKATFAEVSRVVQIGKGLVRENIDLHPQPARSQVALDLGAGASPSSDANGTATTGESRDLTERSNNAEPGTGARPVYKRWWFWTLISVAAVGAGTGAFLLTHRAPVMMSCDQGVACGNWPQGAGALTGN